MSRAPKSKPQRVTAAEELASRQLLALLQTFPAHTAGLTGALVDHGFGNAAASAAGIVALQLVSPLVDQVLALTARMAALEAELLVIRGSQILSNAIPRERP